MTHRLSAVSHWSRRAVVHLTQTTELLSVALSTVLKVIDGVLGLFSFRVTCFMFVPSFEVVPFQLCVIIQSKCG